MKLSKAQKRELKNVAVGEPHGTIAFPQLVLSRAQRMASGEIRRTYKNPRPSRIAAILSRLHNAGLIEIVRPYYRITPAGLAALEAEGER